MNELNVIAQRKIVAKSITDIVNNSGKIKDVYLVLHNIKDATVELKELHGIDNNFQVQRLNSLCLAMAKLDTTRNILNAKANEIMSKGHKNEFVLTQFTAFLLLSCFPIKTNRKFKKSSKALLDFTGFDINNVDSIKFFEWDKERMDKPMLSVDKAAAAFQLFTANLCSSSTFVENGYTFVNVTQCGFINKIEISLDNINWYEIVGRDYPIAIKNPEDTTQFTIYFRVENGHGDYLNHEKTLKLVDNTNDRAIKELEKLKVKVGKDKFITLKTLTVNSIASETEALKNEKNTLIERAKAELANLNKAFNQSIAIAIDIDSIVAGCKDKTAIEQQVMIAFMSKMKEQALSNQPIAPNNNVIDTGGLEQQVA